MVRRQVWVRRRDRVAGTMCGVSSPLARSGSRDWEILVPIKALDRAKSRLATALATTRRRALVLAMAADTVESCLNASRVGRVRVVTSDSEVADLVLALGAEVAWEDDELAALPGSDGLNESLRQALPRSVTYPIGVISGDLPALASAVLDEILSTARTHRRSVVVDHLGDGTTMAFWTPVSAGHDTAASPRDHPRGPDVYFGAGSAARFLHAGAAILAEPVSSGWAGARLDVDRPVDLAAIASLEVGRHTRAALIGADGYT